MMMCRGDESTVKWMSVIEWTQNRPFIYAKNVRVTVFCPSSSSFFLFCPSSSLMTGHSQKPAVTRKKCQVRVLILLRFRAFAIQGSGIGILEWRRNGLSNCHWPRRVDDFVAKVLKPTKMKNPKKTKTKSLYNQLVFYFLSFLFCKR